MANSTFSFSNKELSIKDIDAYYFSTERALRSFYHKTNPYFVGYTIQELQSELDERIDELDKSAAFTILAAIEAYLRIDFIQRCQNKEKDDLSRKFRTIYSQKGLRVSLSEDILEFWTDFATKKSIISELRIALRYRHWLAHGRYWVAKLGRKYDFNSVLSLASQAQVALDIDMGV
jgi:hypothetical protein